ncbi:hypothetical protein SXCC_02159 [Gluconacetobacter sp. SXCC-1]|nr:hypothetical protein CT154_10245 [Komagataeibacter xylinus]EGG76948.1 hypothetical protein SXCC_02159 [Gluconacetobacter sp. SXCC-1]SAY48262.1 hypothetical protein KRIGEM_01208 [Komagataeibacter rhaeticus]
MGGTATDRLPAPALPVLLIGNRLAELLHLLLLLLLVHLHALLAHLLVLLGKLLVHLLHLLGLLLAHLFALALDLFAAAGLVAHLPGLLVKLHLLLVELLAHLLHLLVTLHVHLLLLLAELHLLLLELLLHLLHLLGALGGLLHVRLGMRGPRHDQDAGQCSGKAGRMAGNGTRHDGSPCNNQPFITASWLVIQPDIHDAHGMGQPAQ